jgi:hypothetical protein
MTDEDRIKFGDYLDGKYKSMNREPWLTYPDKLGWQQWSESFGRKVESGMTVDQAIAAIDAEIEEIVNPHQPPVIATPRIEIIDGKMYAGGIRFHWKGVSCFSAPGDYYKGSDLTSTFSFLRDKGFNVIRCFMMLSWMKYEGKDTLPIISKFLDYAASFGLYVEVVALADTKLLPSFDEQKYCNELSAIVAQHENAILEWVNEPYHGTAQSYSEDQLKPLVDKCPTLLPCSQGSTPDFENQFTAGDYVTAHPDRTDGDDGWRHVRHLKEAYDLGQTIKASGRKVPIISDEPIGANETFEAGRRENDPDKFRVMGLMTHFFNPQTFHYQDGLYARLPGPIQLQCMDAWFEGINFFPPAFKDTISFTNAGWGDSPIKEFSNALRCYSGRSNDEAWTLVIDDRGVTYVTQNSFRLVDEVILPHARILHFKR